WQTEQRFLRAVRARDWSQLADVFAPDLILEDHRPLGWGTLCSRDEVVARMRGLIDLAPDATLRIEHVLAINERGIMDVGQWEGPRDGGAFEIPAIAIMVKGTDGRFHRWQFYALDQLDAARALFNTLASGTRALGIETAATRTVEHARQAWEMRDWRRYAA